MTLTGILIRFLYGKYPFTAFYLDKDNYLVLDLNMDMDRDGNYVSDPGNMLLPEES